MGYIYKITNLTKVYQVAASIGYAIKKSGKYYGISIQEREGVIYTYYGQ